MKKLFKLLVYSTFACAAIACSDEADTIDSPASEGNVKFVTRAPQPASERGPVYAASNYRILAFRDAGERYVYVQDIPLGGMGFDGTTLSGEVQLPAGDYKFLPSYGLVAEGNYTWPLFDGAALTDELFVTHTGGSFPEAFMLNTPLSEVPSHTVSLDGPKLTVNATLRRAVSRVDVLFIRADKDPATGAYTEKQGDNVFGPEQLASAELSFNGANSRLGLSGEKADGTFDAAHTIKAGTDVLTMGTGAATVVDTDGYDFDNVKPADIISGSAHLKGTYLIPNPDADPSVGFALTVVSGEGSTRTIALTDKIPVERNRATLIRIYVLGDNVFTTAVEFEVEVVTAWDGSNILDAEIN